MAFDWERVEAIRAEQDSARNRRDLNTLPTNEVSNEIYNSPSGINAKIPGLDHWEQMIHKVRTQLIDYIIEHGLVQGFEYDGINEPIKNGKIVITAEMLQRVTDRFGYFKKKETLEFIEKYLPEHHYVADENYVHTDNNYTDEEKTKLEGIADGAEVNKVISILFNGVESIDPETRVATITITPADIKTWYEQNPNTNVFTDAEKAKLESINIDELSNKVEDVTLDGKTIVKNKVAVLTAKKIKDSYESNADTNAFTNADKTLVEHVLPEIQKGVNQHEQRIDALEKSQITQDSEIEDAKNSITGLGGEVNSVSGRVTALETSQRAQDEEISNLKAKDTAQDGRLESLETWKGATVTTLDELGEKNTAQDSEISKLKAKDTAQDGRLESLETWKGATVTTLAELGEKNAAQDSEISKLKEKDTTQDGRLDALEASEATQDADILQLKTDIKNAGKVDDVTVNGVSVVKNKIAMIPAIPSADNFIPYEGATKDVDLGLNAINTSELTTIYNPNNNKTYQVGSYVSNGFGIDVFAQGGSVSRLEFLTESDGHNSIRGLKVSLPAVTPGKETLGHIRVAIPMKPTDAANKEYVDLLRPRRLSVQLPKERVPKGSSLTLTATVEYPQSPVNGYYPVPLCIIVKENYGAGEAGGGFPAESMCYNYGLDRQGNIFITYFNNDATQDKDPTMKIAIVSYIYIIGEE